MPPTPRRSVPPVDQTGPVDGPSIIDVIDELPQPKSKAAKDAAKVLQNYNVVVASSMMGLGMTTAGLVILNEQEEFARRAGVALDGNDKLCRMISGAGDRGGMLGLCVAYAIMAGSVAANPAARQEIAAVRENVSSANAARKARKAGAR